jgi:hypothetical protein
VITAAVARESADLAHDGVRPHRIVLAPNSILIGSFPPNSTSRQR